MRHRRAKLYLVFSLTEGGNSFTASLYLLAIPLIQQTKGFLYNHLSKNKHISVLFPTQEKLFLKNSPSLQKIKILNRTADTDRPYYNLTLTCKSLKTEILTTIKSKGIPLTSPIRKQGFRAS